MKHIFLAVALLSSANLARSAPIGAALASPNSRTMGATVASADYDPVKKVTTLHIVNTSQKEITAMNVTLTVSLPTGRDSTGLEITPDWAQAAGDINGILPGGSFDYDVIGQEGPTKGMVDVVVYSDDTAEVQNNVAFQRIISSRKARAIAKQKVNNLITEAISNVPERQRAAAVLEQLDTLVKVAENAIDVPWDGRSAYIAELKSAVVNMSNISRNAQGPNGAKTEATSMHVLLDLNSSKIPMLIRHSELVKGVQP